MAARRNVRNDKLMPAVTISRRCFACGHDFTLSHPNDPRLWCEKCGKALGEIICEKRGVEKIF